MSSICWPHTGLEARKQDLRRSIYSLAAITAIWSINLAVIFFGWPFVLYGYLKYSNAGRASSKASPGRAGQPAF